MFDLYTCIKIPNKKKKKKKKKSNPRNCKRGILTLDETLRSTVPRWGLSIPLRSESFYCFILLNGLEINSLKKQWFGLTHYREPTCSIVVIWVKIFQTELMAEIYYKRLVRAIGKVLLMKFSKNTNKIT